MVTLKTESQLSNFVKRMETKYRNLNERTCLSGNHPRTRKTTDPYNYDCIVLQDNGRICGDPNDRGVTHVVFVSHYITKNKHKKKVILFTQNFCSGERTQFYAKVLAIKY